MHRNVSLCHAAVTLAQVQLVTMITCSAPPARCAHGAFSPFFSALSAECAPCTLHCTGAADRLLALPAHSTMLFRKQRFALVCYWLLRCDLSVFTSRTDLYGTRRAARSPAALSSADTSYSSM